MSEEASRRARRRLAAILVAGHSRLFPGDEAEGFAELRAVLSEIIAPLSAQHGGKIFKQTGDIALIEFESVVDAVHCAAALREKMGEKNHSLPTERRIAMRIGINLGDIIAEGGDVFGDGVNIAARLAALAEPGSIYLSENVHDQVAGKVEFDFEYLGPTDLKNIRQPVRVFGMGGAPAEAPGEHRWSEAPASTGEAPFDDRSAIAVLPFVNFSGDPEQEYFADGITEDIITMLAGWRAFPVIARNSTFSYKGQTIDIKTVGRELGVRYVLEGSVRKSGRRVRITAQLIRADTGHHIMAERYDRDLTDLFELQDEITTTIAGAIEPELLKFERDRIADQPQHNEDAYALYQRGMWRHYRHTKPDNLDAQACFRRALAIDPHYPQATAALAIAVCNAAYLGWADHAEPAFDEAFELAQRAVGLDARYPNARFALGLVCLWTSRAERAMAELKEAINLNPSHAAAHVVLGQMFTYRGQPEQAIALAEKGIRLSPNDPRLFMWLPALAAAYYLVENYSRAVEIGRRSWTLNRNWPAGLTYVTAGLAQLGQLPEARAALADLRGLDPDLSFVRSTLQRLYEDRTGIERILDGLRKAGME